MPNRSLTFLFLVTLTITTRAHAQQSRPAWCSHLPRPEYKKLERVRTSEDWFEVYRIQPGVFAIYEPHQYEEVISYLILGSKDALLLDTGMGIGDIRKLVNNLTRLPVGVLNTHTHPDHIGGNYQFQKILGADTPFTRKNSRGYNSAEVKEFLKGDHLCGKLPSF